MSNETPGFTQAINEIGKQTTSAFGTIKKVLNRLHKGGNTHSLIEFTQAANISPLVIIDVDSSESEHISNILNTAHRIFAGYFLQAIELMNAKVNGINMVKLLRPLDPNLKSDYFSHEKFKIPSLESNDQESVNEEKNKKENTKKENTKKENTKLPNYKLSGDVVKSLNEHSNLSTGVMYSINMSTDIKDKDGNVISKAASLPVNIRLMVKILPNSVMTNIIGHTPIDSTEFIDFYHDWRAGSISFIDMLFQKSLVDSHFKTLIEDKSGTYKNIIENMNNKKSFNIWSAITNQTANYSTASNIAIISIDTLKQAISKMGGTSIKDKKVRNAIFENSNLMFLMVLDKSINVVKVFYRGLDDYNELSVSDMKRISSSKDSSSVLDIMKQLLNGNTPSY